MAIQRKRPSGAIAEQLALLGAAVDSGNDVVLILDVTSNDRAGMHRIEYANAALQRITGYAPEEVVGKSGALFFGPKTTEASIATLRAISREPSSGTTEMLIYRKDGAAFWVEVNSQPVKNALGDVMHRVWVWRDISKRKVIEEALRQSEEGLTEAQALAHMGSWEEDLKSGRVRWSAELHRIYGVPTTVGRSIPAVRSFDHPGDVEFVRQIIDEAKTQRKSYSVEHRIVLADGTIKHVLEQGKFSYGEGGVAARLIGATLDVTEHKQAQERLTYVFQHDLLTDLPNRSMLEDRIAQLVAHPQRSSRYAAVLFLNLNRFKLVNDRLGHAAGDELLKAVAKRLSGTLRPNDLIGRFAADEFVVLAVDLEQSDDGLHAARRLFEALAAPFEVVGREIYVTASIGISTYPKDGDAPEALIHNAEIAMLQAKEHGDNACQQYVSTMSGSASRRLSLESDLRKAIGSDELVVHYQPVVNPALSAIIGVEALVRWLHPTLGLLQPSDFIGLAEETGLIVPLGERVLRMACHQAKAWLDHGLNPLRVAVNISRRQFRQADLVQTVERILSETGADPGQLELEITESAVTKDLDAALQILRALKTMGIRISLDDFGTGYSSLGYLKHFPLDSLKIDQSFVRDVASDLFDEAIADTVITVGHSLRLNVIAEGVENEAQLNRLRALRCDEFQGHFFSRPMTVDAFERLFKEGAYLGGIRVRRATGLSR